MNENLKETRGEENEKLDQIKRDPPSVNRQDR